MLNNPPLITIFTPVYNRAHLISQLFNSLTDQTEKNFEWLIVDDGSSDNLENYIYQFQSHNNGFNIIYIKQTNGGKHRAINRGLKEANGELFLILDSDDYLTPDATAFISRESSVILNDNSFAGICGMRCHKDGTPITRGISQDHIDATTIDLRFKLKVQGDLAEVYKTNILRKFPFPEIDNEKFAPEALIWDRVAATGLKTRTFRKAFYVCEYLEGGLTSKITKIRMQSPIASTLYYRELTGRTVPLKIKIKAAINYWRFYFCRSNFSKPPISFSYFWLFPLGFILHLRDSKLIK